MTTHKETVTSPETPAATATPRLEILAAQCGGGTCPTVYRTDRCRERLTVGTPDPTWDTIERFVARALGSRR